MWHYGFLSAVPLWVWCKEFWSLSDQWTHIVFICFAPTSIIIFSSKKTDPPEPGNRRLLVENSSSFEFIFSHRAKQFSVFLHSLLDVIRCWHSMLAWVSHFLILKYANNGTSSYSAALLLLTMPRKQKSVNVKLKHPPLNSLWTSTSFKFKQVYLHPLSSCSSKILQKEAGPPQGTDARHSMHK